MLARTRNETPRVRSTLSPNPSRGATIEACLVVWGLLIIVALAILVPLITMRFVHAATENSSLPREPIGLRWKGRFGRRRHH